MGNDRKTIVHVSQKRESATSINSNPYRGSIRNAPTSTKSKAHVGQSFASQTRKSFLQSRAGPSSATRRGTATGIDPSRSHTHKPPVTVLDDSGKDVTPLPLLHHEGPGVRGKQGNILDSNIATPTDILSQGGSVFQGTMTASAVGGPFTRSLMSASQSDTEMSTDEFGEHEHADPGLGEITRVIHDAPPVDIPTEEDLEKSVELQLEETSTIWLLDLPGTCVAADGEEAQIVNKKNEQYRQLVKSRAGNDRYMERSMNTFNYPLKTKICQTTRIGHADVGITATNWDMYDTYKLQDELEKKVSEDEMIGEPPPSGESDPTKKDSKADAATGDDGAKEKGSDGVGTSALGASAASARPVGESGLIQISGNQDEIHAKKARDVLESQGLKDTLVIMERILNLNLYQPKQALYRGFSIIEDIDAKVASPEAVDSGSSINDDIPVKVKKEKSIILTQSIENAQMTPFLDRLWDYKCPLTKGRNVSCMVWNKLNPDLLAVGYGQFEYNKQKNGLICCWSIKNPEWPERIYTTDSGVTALDFSTMHPNLLAVGLHDGTIAVYNVAGTSNEPMLDSLETAGKHTGPVWQLRWVEKDRASAGEDTTEVLVSVSTDGRVTQWSIRKGFESQDLMRLKREATKTQFGKSKKPEALISKHAGGFSFDFLPANTNIYLAGTEEGSIHKCSCSYNEQYLDSFSGHQGPVYKVQWSPFTSDVFLSCSGDWSARLWHQDRSQSVLKFISANKSIQDICWSPTSSLVFASVNAGAVEIWDLGQNVLDPTTSLRSPREGVSFSTVQFSKNSNCILVGDSDGAVAVLQLRLMAPEPENQAEALHKIIRSCLASQLKK